MLNSESSPGENGRNGKERRRREILYRGYYYDVTDFIRKHPGGSVIKFYAEPGEDATHAIDQFHFRAKNKVEKIMMSLKRRPAETPEEASPNPTHYDEMSKDFRELSEQLQEEGYFEPSYRQVILRFLEAIGMFLLMRGLYIHSPQPIYTKLLAAVLYGFSMSRFGWVMHEGGHKSLTGNTKIDRILQYISFNLFLGGSSVWWNSVHNRHHAMPQRLHHDGDIEVTPFVAFSSKVTSSQFIGFFVKYQGVLYWTVDLFLVHIAWKFFYHPLAQLRNKAYLEILLNIPSYFLMFQLGIFWHFLGQYAEAVIMVLNFSLSHSHLEVTEEPTHWIEYSFTHTVDIRPSLLCDWWMGYLNYQIEHHLFPTMPQFRNQEICWRVKALAEKHGLPYIVHSYPDAAWLAVKNVYDVGQELGNQDWDKMENPFRIACNYAALYTYLVMCYF